MTIGATVRRSVTPRWLTTLQSAVRFRALVSPRAELELNWSLTLGRKTTIGAFSHISTTEGAIQIGARTDVGTGCSISGHPGSVLIGDDCLISPNVVIGGPVHPPPDDQGAEVRPTRIGNNVWIGTGAVILPGAEIADGVIVSPNSVVTGAVQANAIVQGNPGKIIVTRR